MSDIFELCWKAEQFIRNLFKVYLEDRNFPLLISMLHKDITWFGTGAQEVCNSYKDALVLLQMESNSWDGKFKILEQWYKTVKLSEEKYMVYGELTIIEDGLNTILLEMRSRFSMICTIEAGELKLYHAHFSVPNESQGENEFVHKALVKNYNALLEEKLQERTRMLKKKTEELQNLSNNICGGVQICKLDNEFTIEYISDGYTQLTGYTKKEMDTLFDGKHLPIVYAPDRFILTVDLKKQLEAENRFSMQYRIVRKDGQLIWVMDKGMMIQGEEGETKVQCILTDVTVQKHHEEALSLSEKRYEIAMRSSGITMFEYNVVTGELMLFEDDAKRYAVSTVIPNGVENFVKKGIIEPVSAADYKEMYRQIHKGAPSAKCYVKARDKDGKIYDYELSLTNVFDSDGKPVRAIGVRKNVSHILGLQKEQEFGKNLASNKIFIFEADIATNRIEYLDRDWEDSEYAGLNISFTQYIKKIVEKDIFPEHQEVLLQKLSPDYIKKVLESGRSLYTFTYKRKKGSEIYIWYEATINIIKDYVTGNIRIRCYHVNIDERKQKEQRASEEKQWYDVMVAKAILAYEVNITQNLVIKGHENWSKQYGIEKSDNYTRMIKEFSEKRIHPEDREGFNNAFQREHVLDVFSKGKKKIACQYRKPSQNGEYKWVNCLLHLYEDIEKNDVKGFSYVEDIDKEKRAELALRYDAEHDVMTGLLNKTITEQRISKYLETSEGSEGLHALLVIDIDYFKYINDNFGHLFGDGVIKEIASKIRSLCRNNDICGRIGGDEFCVFMKGINGREAAEKKANSICQNIKQTYSRDGRFCSISASVGIAVYKEHGCNYKELYIHADRALYSAKEKGRDRYEIS